MKRQKIVPGHWTIFLFVDFLLVSQNLVLREGIKILPCINLYSGSRLSCLTKDGSVQAETHILMWTRLGGGFSTVSCQVFKPSRYSSVFWWSAYKFFQSMRLRPNFSSSFSSLWPPPCLICIVQADTSYYGSVSLSFCCICLPYNPDFCVSKHSPVSWLLFLKDNLVVLFWLWILFYLWLSKT